MGDQIIWIITSIDTASECGLSYLVMNTKALQNMHGASSMDILICVYPLRMFPLPRFKQVFRPLAFPCLGDFGRTGVNKTYWQSMIPPVFCKRLWQIRLCVQQEDVRGEEKEVFLQGQIHPKLTSVSNLPSFFFFLSLKALVHGCV